jgi:hypothetical protein
MENLTEQGKLIPAGGIGCSEHGRDILRIILI